MGSCCSKSANSSAPPQPAYKLSTQGPIIQEPMPTVSAPNFRPEGAIPDGNGELPLYQPSVLPLSARDHFISQQYIPPPGPPPDASSYHFGAKFNAPPPFLPTPASEDFELPPPPAISHDVSPASNTTPALADAGYEFCVQNALAPPQYFTASALATISSGSLPLASPPKNFKGTISASALGLPSIVTPAGPRGECPDTCLISALPLYCAGYHHPTNTGKPKRIYFEISIEALSRSSTVAVGFVGCPYPGFRMPGWNRGSLGVHSDDGRRYCNDSYGGKDFTQPFGVGESVGIGMIFPTASPGSGIEIYFIRNGQKAGGWRLDEERDAELDWNATEGLDGSSDIYAAIGVWGGGLKVAVQKFVSE